MLLNLEGFTTLRTQDVEKLGITTMCITVETEFEPTTCIKCSTLMGRFYGHGTKKQFFHDAPIHGKTVLLQIYRKRYKCRDCGFVFDEPLAVMHPNHDMTKRLAEMITIECYREKFTDVGRRNGVTEKTVRNVFRAHVENMRTSYKFETPEFLGIDEINIRQMRAVFTNLKEKTIIEMLPGRTKAEVTGFLLTLDRSKVKVVSIDMWLPYKDACAIAFPGAVVVVDRFHVQKMANEIMTQIRVKAVRELDKKGQKRLVKKGKYLLLARNFNLNDYQQDALLELIALCPILGDALVAKERFMDIWNVPDRATAELKYAEWKDSLSAELKPHFKAITTAFGNWHEQIFNWWDHRITNAFTESVNGKIRELHRAGRGYSFEVLRARIISKLSLHKVKSIPSKIDRNVFERLIFQRAPNYGVDISTLLGVEDLDSD